MCADANIKSLAKSEELGKKRFIFLQPTTFAIRAVIKTEDG